MRGYGPSTTNQNVDPGDATREESVSNCPNCRVVFTERDDGIRIDYCQKHEALTEAEAADKQNAWRYLYGNMSAAHECAGDARQCYICLSLENPAVLLTYQRDGTGEQAEVWLCERHWLNCAPGQGDTLDKLHEYR